jgi:hypothetical protein
VFSPILLDLSGTGFQLTDALHGVSFDLAGLGHRSMVGWTAPGANNVFLIFDRNSNGVVDDGKELFGTATPQPDPVPPASRNGYAALAAFDVNGDSQITAADPIYYDLRLWRDTNHNGISDPGELMTLRDAGVTSVGLDYKESPRRDPAGNAFRYRARVTIVDKTGTHTRWSYDVFLVGM